MLDQSWCSLHHTFVKAKQYHIIDFDCLVTETVSQVPASRLCLYHRLMANSHKMCVHGTAVAEI